MKKVLFCSLALATSIIYETTVAGSKFGGAATVNFGKQIATLRPARLQQSSVLSLERFAQMPELAVGVSLTFGGLSSPVRLQESSPSSLNYAQAFELAVVEVSDFDAPICRTVFSMVSFPAFCERLPAVRSELKIQNEAQSLLPEWPVQVFGLSDIFEIRASEAASLALSPFSLTLERCAREFALAESAGSTFEAPICRIVHLTGSSPILFEWLPSVRHMAQIQPLALMELPARRTPTLAICEFAAFGAPPAALIDMPTEPIVHELAFVVADTFDTPPAVIVEEEGEAEALADDPQPVEAPVVDRAAATDKGWWSLKSFGWGCGAATGVIALVWIGAKVIKMFIGGSSSSS